MPTLSLDSTSVEAGARRVAEKRMAQACEVVVRRAKERLNNSAAGMRHRGPGASFGGAHSLEGQSPFKITARLFNSITSSVIGTSMRVLGRVGSKVVYARRLELGFVGTDRRGRSYHQGPRPYLRPALHESVGEIKQIFGGKT